MDKEVFTEPKTEPATRGSPVRARRQQETQASPTDKQTSKGKSSPIKTLNTQFTTGVTGTPKRNDNYVILYRDKSLQQLPTTTTNTLIENVFLISAGAAVGEELPEHCVYVPETAKKAEKQPLLSNNNLEEAVFERLMLDNPSSVTVMSVTNRSKWKTSIGGPCDEKNVLKYLFQCFIRWKRCKEDNQYATLTEEMTKCEDAIFENTRTCLRQPELFIGHVMHIEFIDLCVDNKELLLDKNSIIYEFLLKLYATLETDQGCLMDCFSPVLKHIRQHFQTELKLMNSSEVSQYMLVLKVFTLKPSVAQMFMDFNSPTDWDVAICYEATLIGSILNMNPCPRTNKGPYEFFNSPLDISGQEINTTLVFIWQRLRDICSDLNSVLMAIVRLSEDLRHMVLTWFGKCLQANRAKPDLWSAHEVEVFNSEYCSDGFCLNLCHVLLHMCQPFCEAKSHRLLKVKPSYCRAAPKSDDERKTMWVHARGLDKEPTFVPYSEDKELPKEETYSFIAECFFLTHQALHIGYNIIFKMLKLNSGIARMRKLYEAIKNVYPKRVIELVKQQLNREICWYLNIKAAITEYHLTKMCLNFHIATASWLVQVATCDNVTEFKPVTLPLDNNVPKSLSYLPHYILTNLTQFVTPLDIFQSLELLTSNVESLEHYITVILVFMGRADRLVSSDVRAQLAEALEIIVPSIKDDGTWTESASGNPEKLFREHPLIEHLGETLLSVFVSIEMTGQNVDDEKKFNYRKSMHKILQYIWKIPLHKNAIKQLSENAMSTIDNPEPPLFLRFINLLINDAIFLLDEALDHMKRIRTEELERDSGKWTKLTAEQFRDKETGLRQLGMMGHYRNIMANHTIYTLEILTREIRGIFCHPVMVDRIAGMLNYFMEHLVGPKQRDYKVKDRKEYEFKPEQIVSDIAHIYVYLGRDENFCKAVLGESRSFSHNLLPQAVSVLSKIGVSQDFIAKFEDLSVKLKSLEVDQKREEEMVTDAPEEYLDPIMGTLMLDPVRLPTSSTNIDRAILARHLLSDQRDPFTNLPLSMEMVTPNTELREKIEEWKRSKLQGEKSSSDS
ncbi:ubiquitin conjugation factor E4 A-like isoform X2 [Ruditapes philippinarum]|uniref:ubiquitin conjugation factor E4 A-like isoform X2 n=1 Tax=Ruditapes philippinarum TaxID=129788 RepID=UPI00295C2236|nr:ubiquitin conjugation factor E4 A-like isoform X2 [Ruditapes philippinarum]